MSDLGNSWSRREFVQGLTVAAAAGVLGMHPEEAAAESPPETKTLRVLEIPALCWAPQYVMEELLRAEGFSRVQYVKREIGPEIFQPLGSGQADITIDAYMAFPPEPQNLRTKKVGHVVWSMAADRPWSQYFCCMAAANAEFIRRNPVATKRALRAILKAADLCAAQPERMAKSLVDRGRARNYEDTLHAIKDVRYERWHEYNPEDTVRFYALRLHEVGMLKSSPQKIIAQGTDWRFFNELSKELKA
jgi:ABC-type nitrate/sulfonate/bicarbonate transport system substrate-binding protein